MTTAGLTTRPSRHGPAAELDRLAAAVTPGRATIVVVGPSTAVIPQLAAAGLGAPEVWDAEGSPLVPAARPRPKTRAPAAR